MTGFMFSTETMAWVALAFTTGFAWMAVDLAAARVKAKVTA